MWECLSGYSFVTWSGESNKLYDIFHVLMVYLPKAYVMHSLQSQSNHFWYVRVLAWGDITSVQIFQMF